MVATVGSIAVDLSANTAKFIAGFQKSATTVERESKRMSNAISGFSKKASGIGSAFIGGIVAGGTLAAISSLTGAISGARQALSDFEEIGNRAKATGLSTDTFQAISHGASLADVEQESLNKSLEIFAKNAGLAKEGMGTLYSGLLKLNPQLLQSVLHATSQEERLKLVADAMAGMTDATDKAALATAVFGKGGAEMVRVLDKGAQSIEEMKRNAAELGIIIPEDLIARSGELDDKLTTLSTVIGVNLKEALAKSGPLLVSAAEAMVKLAKGVNAASDAYDAFMGVLHPEQIAVVNKELYDTQVQMAEVEAQIKEAEAALAEFLKHKDEPGGMFDVVESQKELAGLRAQLDELDAHAKDIKVTVDTSQARAAIDRLRSSDLAALWADAEGGGGAGGLPNVRGSALGGSKAVDEAVMDKVEDAIDKETEATKGTTRAVERTTGAVQSGFANMGGSFRNIGDALRSIPWNQRTMASANKTYEPGQFSFSGISSGSSSWAGRRFTIGSGGGSEPMHNRFGKGFWGTVDPVLAARAAGGADASSITGGGTSSAAINVNVTVRPILEGTRLSAQSTAEIKQAAAAGANAALRQFNGR